MQVAGLLAAAATRIGGPSPRLDAELLLAHAAGLPRGQLLLRDKIEIDLQRFEKLVDRRAGGEPVAYLVGQQDFWTLSLLVSPAVLIPRPDSETLVEVALRLCRPAPARILDLGTGSGALLLACLSEWPQATGLGIDASAAALAVAMDNAARNRLSARAGFRQGDWGQGLDERFDLILCNPPYIAHDDPDVDDSVRAHEPPAALFAGADGLADYRRLIPQLPGLLAQGGRAVLEIGHRQAAEVLDLAAAAGLVGTVFQDLAGKDRCVALSAAPPP